MLKDGGQPAKNQSMSIIISLVLIMCVARVVHVTFTPPVGPTSSQTPSSQALDEVRKQAEQLTARKLAHARLDFSTRETSVQRKLKDILASAPRDKPWNEVGQYIIDQSKSFLPQGAPAASASITLVSGIFDVGPEGYELEISDDNALSKRFLAHPQKKIIFVDQNLLDLVVDSLDESTKVVIVDVERMRGYFGYAYADLHKIINNPNWKYSVGWLRNAPQAEFVDFNLVGISKVFLLREAARLNPWNTESFLWMDPGLSCVPPEALTADKMSLFNQHFDRFLLSFFSYKPDIETHGFQRWAFDEFLDNDTPYHKVVKGWTFGGRPEFIEVVAVLVDLVMRETLRQGHMGNSDCILTIVMYRFADVIHPFDLSSACATSTNYDHSCPGFTNHAGWCAMFEWSLKGPPKS
eukprot:c15286_g1_i1.p1 GENE.c15286_g1_i1~~c15286_g1_i1.p1  ORF type:complete len:409 (-),score=86.86 c15286_g1_i1:194-1420(-)